jgi:beta-lactamase class A
MRFAIFISLSISFAIAGCSEFPNASNDLTAAAPVASPSRLPDQQLRAQITEIAKEANGKVGVYATVLETGQSVALNENEHFAMQSVVKLPISMAVLKRVEEGKLDSDERIGISKDEMVPSNMRSPIRDTNPNGGEMSVRELIRYAMSESDGTAADVLQRVAGGATGVQAYIDSLGIRDMKVVRSHKEFGQKWELQYENWVTPAAANEVLIKLYAFVGISKEHRELLLKDMTESNNPAGRIVAGLPKETVVAHKTGTGGTQDGITSATNDVGIITLPNGNHVAIAVFVGDSKADLAKREGVIAKITKAIFDKWSQTQSKPVKTANFTERHTLN